MVLLSDSPPPRVQLYLLSLSFLLCALFLLSACSPCCLLLLDILRVLRFFLFFFFYSLKLIGLMVLRLSCVSRLPIHPLSFLAAPFFSLMCWCLE